MEVDVAVVGGGIAGVSLAAELVQPGSLRVALLEQESQLAYHASGRSAATFLESYGSPQIRALTRASRPVFDQAGEAQAPLLSPRPLIWLAGDAHRSELDALVAAEPLLRPLDEAQVRRFCPAIRPGWAAAGAIETGAQDLDVAGLFEYYRRMASRAGVHIVTRARVSAGEAAATGWRLHTDAGELRASIVVNAAGAWADVLARRCGARPIGLTPMRRTVAVASTSEPVRGWPLVADIAEGFYFRPEGDALLLS
ncbi:MAG TPA: FAD-dependent oxidoreductase, partial [Micromonosporaceae bacterium]